MASISSHNTSQPTFGYINIAKINVLTGQHDYEKYDLARDGGAKVAEYIEKRLDEAFELQQFLNQIQQIAQEQFHCEYGQDEDCRNLQWYLDNAERIHDVHIHEIRTGKRKNYRTVLVPLYQELITTRLLCNRIIFKMANQFIEDMYAESQQIKEYDDCRDLVKETYERFKKQFPEKDFYHCSPLELKLRLDNLHHHVVGIYQDLIRERELKIRISTPCAFQFKDQEPAYQA